MIQKFRPPSSAGCIAQDFEPGFDLDAALAKARDVAGRDDAAAHLGADA